MVAVLAITAAGCGLFVLFAVLNRLNHARYMARRNTRMNAQKGWLTAIAVRLAYNLELGRDYVQSKTARAVLTLHTTWASPRVPARVVLEFSPDADAYDSHADLLEPKEWAHLRYLLAVHGNEGANGALVYTAVLQQ